MVLESVNGDLRSRAAGAPRVYSHDLGPSRLRGRRARRQRDRMNERTANGRRASVLAGLREFLYGMTGHEFARHAVAARASLEHLFILVTMGDLVGVPILPPYYSLRLLPYVVPQISTWKRRMLREKDLTDAMF